MANFKGGRLFHFVPQRAWLTSAILYTCLAICIAIAGILWHCYPASLDFRIYDAFMAAQPAPPSPKPPVIVAIDTTSCEEMGPWPWPRYIVANLVAKIADAGATAIGLDLPLHEADRTSLFLLSSELRESRNIRLDLKGLKPEELDNDKYLADILAQSKVVLAGTATDMTRWAGKPAQGQQVGDRLPVATDFAQPLAMFLTQTPFGTTNVWTDDDGMVRGAPLLVDGGLALQPAFALRLAMRALNVRDYHLDGGKHGLHTVSVGKRQIPVGQDGTFRPRFKKADSTYRYYSASDVLAGPANDAFAGRIVLVGLTALGGVTTWATSTDPAVPEVEMQALFVDSIVNGQGVRILTDADDVQCLLVVGLAMLLGLVFASCQSLMCISTLLVLLAAVWGGAWALFGSGWYMSPIPATSVVLLMCGLLPLRAYHATRARQAARAMGHTL